MRVRCLSNLRNIVLANLAYASDNDDRLPDRDRWMDAIEPWLDELAKLKSNSRQMLTCPELREQMGEETVLYGYAFNSRLSRALIAKISVPARTPLAYDSVNLARNASDPTNSLPEPGRHGRGNVVAYADGHVKILMDLPTSVDQRRK